MFEQAFKNIDDVLWKEAGCTTELDYTEQNSWLLFLKYLDGLEQDKAVTLHFVWRRTLHAIWRTPPEYELLCRAFARLASLSVGAGSRRCG
jgi:hypothetical protein